MILLKFAKKVTGNKKLFDPIDFANTIGMLSIRLNP